MSSFSKVLILGNYRQSLTVIRSLSRAGYHVIAGKKSKRAFTDYSRYTAEIWQHPDIKENEMAFITAFKEFLSRCSDISYVFPIGDTQCDCFARHSDKLPSSVTVIMPDPSVIMTCQDKLKTYEKIKELEIPQPQFQKINSYEELLQCIERIGCPCIIKPKNSFVPFFDEKAIIVKEPESIDQLIPHWPEGNELLIVQQLVRGHRYNCQSTAVEGRMLSYFEQKVLRTDRINYTGIGVDGISVPPTPSLKQYTQRLIKELNYSGASCVQFLVDEESGSENFLEINPRLDATCAIPFYCGYDFPRMTLECFEYIRGLRSEPPEKFSPYPTGRRGVWLMGDLREFFNFALTSRLDRKLALKWMKNIVKTFFSGDFHLTWSWKDPLPTFFIYSRFANILLKTMTERLFGKWKTTGRKRE